jgi:glycosyltransferase involved in cell wall biosynthesis
MEWRATRSPGPSVPSEIRRFAQIVAACKPDVVHLHSAKAGLAGRLALRGRLPTVFQPNAWSFEAVTGPMHTASAAWERLGARWTDVIVCVSEGERELGEAHGVRAPYELVHNGTDLERYAPATGEDRAAARRELGLPDVPLAVLVGRLGRQKGQDVLLRAWPRVLESVPDAMLALVGHGPDREMLEAMGVPRVKFLGQRFDVPSWLAAANVAVMPSRWEGMSLVPMEAMARARSVVATDVSGTREMVGPGCGVIVPVEAEAPLAEALIERLRDSALADREGAAGRAWVEERYDVRKTAAQVSEIYEDIVARRDSDSRYRRRP